MELTENEQSRIGINFGEDFQGDGNQYIKAVFQINKDAANTQLHQLEADTESKISIPWSVVLALTLTSENKESIIEYVQKLQECDKEYDNMKIYQNLCEGQTVQELEIQKCEVGEKIYVSFELKGEPRKEIEANFQPFFELGLNQIAESQNNKIEALISTQRTGQEVLEKIKGGERAMSAVLQNFKFESNLSINKNFGNKIKEVVSQIDADFSNSPPFIFLRYFKGLDIDLRFGSTGELPQSIRNKVLLGELLQSGEDLSIQQESFKALSLLQSMDVDLEVFFTIPDFLAVNLKGHNFAISQYLTSYGKLFL